MELKKKCIYILEDNDDIRELIAFLLIEENYDVHGYPTIKSFQKEMRYATPDMIILDVMLGDGNGIDVCDRLKSNERTHDIPVLMMSAHTYYNEIKQKCAAEDFISKPFDINDFIRKVDHYLN